MKKRTEFLFYGYNPPTSGAFRRNGVEYRYGEDFRNAKRYREYRDCGFNVLQARYENAFKGGEWEGSNCQLVFEEARKGGCDKIIVTDERFDEWIRENDLIGEGKRFADEKALDAAVVECVSPYCNQEGFFGVQLLDEPTYANIPAYGQLVRSLRRALPDAYLQCNLFPINANAKLLSPSGDQALQNSTDATVKFAQEQIGKLEVYNRYVTDFLDATEINYVLFDKYPFLKNYTISGDMLANYQLVARICQERNLEFYAVLQSFSHVWSGNYGNRNITESDMYWQTNLALGFGVREFSFYTYMTKPDFNFQGNCGGEVDGACFLNLDGSRTALYTYAKRIIREMKRFSRVALKYSYQTSHVVTEKGKTNKDFSWTEFLYEDEECPIDVCVDKGVTLITRSTNGDDKLYMIENIGNVKDELFDNVPPMNVKIFLPSGNKNFYFRGKKIPADADRDGAYAFSLKVGDAVFVEIKRGGI